MHALRVEQNVKTGDLERPGSERLVAITLISFVRAAVFSFSFVFFADDFSHLNSNYRCAMDSDAEEMYDDYDSGNESSGDDVEFAMAEEPNNPKDRQELEEYPYEVLTTEQILQHMNECMKEVNIVVEVSYESNPSTSF